MKALDRLLQAWRIQKVRQFLRPGARVLDVGCADGALFRRLAELGPSVGIDAEAWDARVPPHVRLIRGAFPQDVPDAEQFDAITLLAVLEHVPSAEQPAFARACAERLVRGGRLLVTVPSPRVDDVLHVLMKARLLDGMETGQHYGFDPKSTRRLFETAGLTCIHASRFQLGLNHVFVFEKP